MFSSCGCVNYTFLGGFCILLCWYFSLKGNLWDFEAASVFFTENLGGVFFKIIFTPGEMIQFDEHHIVPNGLLEKHHLALTLRR